MSSMLVKNGLRLRIMSGVNTQVVLACKEFSKWLRKNYQFPVRVNVYIKNDYKVISKKNEQASAIFFGPFDKSNQPRIKVATGDFDELTKEYGIYSAEMSILCSYAHEIAHYFQWYQDRRYSEKEAKALAVEMIETFSEYKDGLITLNRKFIRLIRKADKLLESGDYQEANKYYDKVLECNPEIYAIYCDKGDIFHA